MSGSADEAGAPRMLSIQLAVWAQPCSRIMSSSNTGNPVAGVAGHLLRIGHQLLPIDGTLLRNFDPEVRAREFVRIDQLH